MTGSCSAFLLFSAGGFFADFFDVCGRLARSESSRATWPNCPPVFALPAATQLLQKQRDAPTTELVYAHPALGGYRFGLRKR